MKNNAAFPAHGYVVEPALAFHSERVADTDIHPLRGLTQFGPYSRSLIQSVFDPIRIAFISPQNTGGAMARLLRELNETHQPEERKAYLTTFNGFKNTFGVQVIPADESCRRLLDIEAEVTRSAQPHLTLAHQITRAISSLQAVRASFDVLIIYLPTRWEKGFRGSGDDDFDLHDYLKATTAALNIPTQLFQESTMQYRCRASVMWRLSIALYCKAGGVPYKLANTDPETAFIGLSYALHPNQSGPNKRFVTCCSQIFDADGAGLQFLTYSADDIKVERDNPYLSRAEMLRVMSRSLQLYQRRHAGRMPRRIVVHKSTEFKQEEITGCQEAFQAVEEIELLQIQDSSPWRGLQVEQPIKAGGKGTVSNYPCHRGTFLPLGGREVLLWTQGDAPEVALKDGHFYKEGKAIPSPLFIKRFAGHGLWEQTCQEILSLTKMNWNNDSLYDRLPVTLAYASVLARTLKRMPDLPARAHEFRFFM